MSSRQKPEVVRRVRRGRSAPDSKHKTDSGCFVDEELERNGSSDSSSGSLNSSPSREENQNLGIQIKDSAEKEPKAAGAHESPGKLQDGNSFEKEAMSKDETSVSSSEVKADNALNKESDHAGDAVEKARQASDFYCLYYSASPEGTLTRCDKNALRSKPPVPPKPKQRRGSAPPSSFSNDEKVQWRNREAKKHLFHDSDRPKSDTMFGLFQESEKKTSVGERVLYFETFVSSKEFVNEQSSPNMSTDANLYDVQVAEQEKYLHDSHGHAPLVKGEDSLCELTGSCNSFNMVNCTSLPGNAVAVVNLKELSLEPADTHSPLTCDMKNVQNSHEKTVPLVSPEESFTEPEDSADSSNGTSLLMDTVPLVDPEQSLIDDSRSLSQKGLDKITEMCGRHDYSHIDTHDLDGAEDDQGIVFLVASKDGNHSPSSFDTVPYRCNGADENLRRNGCTSQEISGLFLESKECSSEEKDSARLELSSDISSTSGCCGSWLSYSDSTGCQNNLKDHILKRSLDEIKQELANNSHLYSKTDNEFQPRSIYSLPCLEKKDFAQLKRRSWSAYDAKPKAIDSRFVRKVCQNPASKLTTSMWQSADSLSSPFDPTLHQNKATQNSSPDVAGLSSKKIACRNVDLRVSHVERQDLSGYVSDDSSVHSEPLFRPLKKKSHNVLNGVNIFRSVSDESVTSGLSCTEADMSSFSKASQKQFQHSIGSRDPLRALRRQSMEFAEEQEFPSFRPISPLEAPRVQTLRRSNSNTSSSSDSEVERIFKQAETSNSLCSPHITGSSHDAIVTAVNNHKVTAMEALFGPQAQRNSTPVSDSCTSRLITLSERLSEVQPQASTDRFVFEESLEMEEFLDDEENELKGADEPGLEFDDTDYSEFYTLCEDKESIISAEALSVKKLLQSPQTVLPDPDIESVVLSTTERKAFSPNSAEHKEKGSSQTVSSSLALDQILVDELLTEETSAEIEAMVQLEKRNRGTQTPPPAVFKVLSPSPSVGTQTSPVCLAQDPSVSAVRGPYAPPNSSLTKELSPPPSQSCKPQAVAPDYFRNLSPSVDSFFSPTLPPPLQDNKAISVEELLQILANMPADERVETPPAPRRRVSIQRYNQDMIAGTDAVPRSLPSSWQHLHHSEEKGDGSTHLRSSIHMQRSAKSHDCIRQSLMEKERKAGVIQAKMVGCTESSENIRRKLMDWKLRSRLFEEEVECMEDKDAKRRCMQVAKERALKVSYDGSESTGSIETQSKLTRTHSLKRPRKDRAFSQKETRENSDKIGSSLSTNDMMQSLEGRELHPGDTLLNDNNVSCSETGETSFNVTSDSILAAKIRDKNETSDTTEVGSPGGISVFIDYRKKNGMHIMCTSTPKPPTEPEHCFFDRDGRVGNVALDKADMLQVSEKPVGSSTVDDVQAEVESQGDASSSSYSSDDDPFGDFGGSTETVVFVDTEPSIEISVTPDNSVEDSLDLKLEKTADALQPLVKGGDFLDDNASLDALLGEARKSLNMEYLDTDILDKAIERFKQKVSPKSQNKTRSSGLSMEAYVALHQADELQGIISEIKGELKLLQDENVMLREQVESLANHQTAGEVTENSSTESSERLEHTYRLPNAKHGDQNDDVPVEVDVFLRGFSTAPLHHMPSKKRDILLGTVSVEGADWNGVIETARKTFVEHISRIDPDDYLCLGAHSIQGVQSGVIVWSPGSLKRQSPRVSLSQKSNPCTLQLKDGSHFSCDSLVYETLLPKEAIEKYVEELLENRCIVLCGQQGLGKSYLAARLAEHIVQRIGWKRTPSVITYNVAQKTRKELKEKLNSLLQCNISSPKDGTPAVIVLDQLNCLASLADIFELSQLQGNKTCPYIIGVRDKSRKGPFSLKELTLCQYFRWLRVSVHDRQYAGLLGRFLRRKLSWSKAQFREELGELLSLFDWLSKLLYHLNEILEEFCEPDSAIGPSLFFSCPMDFKAAEGWFGAVWNNIIIPYLHQSLRAGRKIFSRYICWEDPTKWVVLRYPWNKDQSRVLPTLRKLRQVDIVLNRNQLGSDNISFAEFIEDNERILRAQSTMSKRVRTVVQEKIPKGQLNAKRRFSKERESHRYYDDKDSCYSDTDSYLETSI